MSALLFVPAGETRKFEKACGLPLRGVVVDVEDAIPLDRKDAARAAIAGHAEVARALKCRMMVRINSQRTPFWEADLRAVVAAGVHEIVVPKCESVEEMELLDGTLAGLEQHAGLERGTVRVMAMIETARGLLDMREVLGAAARTVSAMLGFADLCLDLGTSWEASVCEQPQLFIEERTRLVVISRALGMEPPWDPVYLRIDDPVGYAADVRLGVRVGSQGKFCIHPSQLEAVNAAYRISPEEISQAESFVRAYEEASATGRGAIKLDGILVDEPVVAQARALLRRAGAAN